jgi:hypothetical protein
LVKITSYSHSSGPFEVRKYKNNGNNVTPEHTTTKTVKDAYKWAEKQLGDVLKEGMVKDLKKKLASQGIGSQAYSDGGEGIGMKGWMSPKGKVHNVPIGSEHAFQVPACLKKYAGRLDKIQQAGYVRFGKHPSSISGDIHYVHFDAKHPKAHATALKALKYMEPQPYDHVLIQGKPGYDGIITKSHRQEQKTLAAIHAQGTLKNLDAREMTAAKAYQYLRAKAHGVSEDEIPFFDIFQSALKRAKKKNIHRSEKVAETGGRSIVPKFGLDDHIFSEEDDDINDKIVPSDTPISPRLYTL